ncbi:MAG: hypothetical protein ACE5HX_17670, partial [bacterium]
GDYWLGIHSNANWHLSAASSVGENIVQKSDEYDDGASNPFGDPSYTEDDFQLSIYATLIARA